MQKTSSISRRQLLKTSALVGAGIGLSSPALLRTAHAADTPVTFAGWAFEPQVVEAARAKLAKAIVALPPGHSSAESIRIAALEAMALAYRAAQRIKAQ